MIGNDIVDRAQAKRDSNWQRRGFLDKLFSAEEQQLIRAANDLEGMVWLLWSMKESAYKATTRKTGKRAFNPVKISCTLESWSDDAAEGLVFYESEYRTKSVITPHYIASVAFPANGFAAPGQRTTPLERADYQSQSTELRNRITQDYTTVLPGLERNAQVGKDQYGSPVLVISNSLKETICLPISLSHHGHYGAYSVDWANDRHYSTIM